MIRSRLVPVQPLFVIVLAWLTASCATPGTSDFQYRDPIGEETVANEAVVRLSFSDTWDLLMGQLAKSFFVINNVAKVSRIIDLSFSTDKPEEYIDCGTSERTFQYAKESQTYIYPVARSSSFKVAGKWGPYENLPMTSFVDRKTSLEGRINVYVAPKHNNTIVTVNTRYIFTVHTSGQIELINAYGQVTLSTAVPVQQSTVSFNTGQIGSVDWGTPQQPNIVKCRSTGKLETEILVMTKRYMVEKLDIKYVLLSRNHSIQLF